MESTAVSPLPIEDAWVTPLYVYQSGVEATPPTLALMCGPCENPNIIVRDLAKLANSSRWLQIKNFKPDTAKE